LVSTFDVIAASDGDEGWDRVREHLPDLVISDIMMPGRTGTELCQAIKRDSRLHTIPVILLTARVGSEATLEGYAHGADEFVAKPFHPAVLLARVRAQLKLRALSLKLAEREKLVAVGTLAAGILHEVRNPVNAILNGAELLTSSTLNDKTRASLVNVIRDGATRIHGITTSLEAHVRPAEDTGPSLLDIGEGLDATITLMHHQMGHVEVLREYAARPVVAGEAGRLNQVFLNLVDNAVKAGAKRLSLGISERDGVARIRIGDDGGGIPPSVADRIFDPFFTTREPGVGMGLGLYICRAVVEDHGGKLWFETRPGGGTEFFVELPVSDKRYSQPAPGTP
jgi:signal transduction histidine kinase